jgi:hypothetical protein
VTPEESIVHWLVWLWDKLSYPVPVWGAIIAVFVSYAFGKSRGVKQILHRQGIAKSKVR